MIGASIIFEFGIEAIYTYPPWIWKKTSIHNKSQTSLYFLKQSHMLQ